MYIHTHLHTTVKSITMAPLYLSAVWLVCSAVLVVGAPLREDDRDTARNSLQAIEETNTGGWKSDGLILQLLQEKASMAENNNQMFIQRISELLTQDVPPLPPGRPQSRLLEQAKQQERKQYKKQDNKNTETRTQDALNTDKKELILEQAFTQRFARMFMNIFHTG